MKRKRNKNIINYNKILNMLYEYNVSFKFIQNIKKTKYYKITDKYEKCPLNDFVIEILQIYPNNIYEFLLKLIHINNIINFGGEFSRLLYFYYYTIFNGTFNINVSTIMSFGVKL